MLTDLLHTFRRMVTNGDLVPFFLDTLRDIFESQMDNSDPMLSSFHVNERMKYRKIRNLPEEVEKLLIRSENSDFGVGVMFEKDVEANNVMMHFLDMFDEYQLMEV